MDESWRMRMWMPDCPVMNHHPHDFSDVFGGPPKSVLLRQFSSELGHTELDFYFDKMLQPLEFVSNSANNAGRRLSVFRTPTVDEEFYNDILGSNHGRERSSQNSKGKSKSDSSSVLSSEAASPFRDVTGAGVVSSSFADMLRPINIPAKWNSSKMKPKEHHDKHGMSFFSFNHSSSIENQSIDNEINEAFRSSYFGFPRTAPSSEPISIEPTSYRSMKVSVDDLEPNSPSSAISSLCHESRAKMLAEEDDEVMSSYVIEIGSDTRTTSDKIGTIHKGLAWPPCKDNRVGTNEAIELDEVIAWAKEKFNSQTSETDLSTRLNDSQRFVETEGKSGSCEISGERLGAHDIRQFAGVEERICSAEEEKKESENEMEMEDIDEDIKLWSSGKMADIRLLLSTLHHILWPRSGWHVTPLASLREVTQVKKAYQKARLCLHPDKLQQRGATNMQKYVAEKAFAIVQEAWTTFISQDAFF